VRLLTNYGVKIVQQGTGKELVIADDNYNGLPTDGVFQYGVQLFGVGMTGGEYGLYTYFVYTDDGVAQEPVLSDEQNVTIEGE